MPGRLEFETEYENEAETLVKDLEFGRVYQFGGDLQPAGEPPAKEAGEDEEEEEEEEKGPPPKMGEAEGDEPESELELKLAILEMFNERYDKRMANKELIFDRGLMNYKQVRAVQVTDLSFAGSLTPRLLTACRQRAETDKGRT